LANQLADSALCIVCGAAAEEERRVFFSECVEPSVWADGITRGFCRRWLAVNGPQKLLKHVRCIEHSRDVGEVDPGENAEKIKRGISRSLGQDDWHNREGWIARLTDQGKVALVLLGVAEPTRPDQHDHGLGGADDLFQRANPRQTPR